MGWGGILQGCPLSTVIIIALNLLQSDCICNRRFSVNPNQRSKLTLSIGFEVKTREGVKETVNKMTKQTNNFFLNSAGTLLGWLFFS